LAVSSLPSRRTRARDGREYRKYSGTHSQAYDVHEPQRRRARVDDFQIPLGTFRFRAEGSAGGHNGLKSIEGALQSQQYARLRIGVGPLPEGTGDWADYVLAPFDPEQRDEVEGLMPQMIETVEQWLNS